jgi:hypothetical protein
MLMDLVPWLSHLCVDTACGSFSHPPMSPLEGKCWLNRHLGIEPSENVVWIGSLWLKDNGEVGHAQHGTFPHPFRPSSDLYKGSQIMF